ncbi:hypothetical protein E4U41_006486 [Claviceps citrina]|nr:hypothetical protein E4U41_006486 [Claviceps citrina]
MAKPAAFHIDVPLADDAPIISDIHLRAMDSDLLTHAQFPNTQALDFFRDWITSNTVEHSHEAGKGVLVARDAATGEIANVTFVCTDPKWAGRGAASGLLRDLKDMAAGAGKAIILEAVMPAVPLYKRLGFGIRQQLQLMLPPRGSTTRTKPYVEECMVWTPPSPEME